MKYIYSRLIQVYYISVWSPFLTVPFENVCCLAYEMSSFYNVHYCFLCFIFYSRWPSILLSFSSIMKYAQRSKHSGLSTELKNVFYKNSLCCTKNPNQSLIFKFLVQNAVLANVCAQYPAMSSF